MRPTYTEAADMLRENLAGAAAGAKATDRDANVKTVAIAANFMVPKKDMYGAI